MARLGFGTATRPARAADPERRTGLGRRALIFVVSTFVGWVAVGAVDHWVHRMSQHDITAALVAVAVTALVSALLTPWRFAAVVALVVGLAFGGLVYSQQAQDKVATGWAHASAFIGKHVHRGGSGR